jgi:hypothetical protein
MVMIQYFQTTLVGNEAFIWYFIPEPYKVFYQKFLTG